MVNLCVPILTKFTIGDDRQVYLYYFLFGTCTSTISLIIAFFYKEKLLNYEKESESKASQLLHMIFYN